MQTGVNTVFSTANPRTNLERIEIDLQVLSRFRSQGILTEDEYDTAKRQLLAPIIFTGGITVTNFGGDQLRQANNPFGVRVRVPADLEQRAKETE